MSHEFDIVQEGEATTFLQIYSDSKQVHILLEVSRADIEALRAVLPEQPPNHSDNDDE